jgi:hypothetical protein
MWPRSFTRKNQRRTANSVHAAAEMKNRRGAGKKEMNIGCLGGGVRSNEIDYGK